MTFNRISTLLAAALLGVSAQAAAQKPATVSSATLDAAVASARPQSNRAALRAFLATSEALGEAARLGVDAADLSAQVATLDDETVDRFARRHGLDNRVLAGGDTIVISTTAVIIGLLILILLTD